MSGQPIHPPPWWRAAVGFAAAPALPTLLISALSPAYEGLPDLSERIWRTFQLAVVFIGYLPAVVVGLPLFLFMRRRVQMSPLSCSLAGAFTAALPWLLLTLLPLADSASEGGHATIINHQLTAFGFLQAMLISSLAAALGALGGLVFWALVSIGSHRAVPTAP